MIKTSEAILIGAGNATKSYVDKNLDLKAEKTHTHTINDLDNSYFKDIYVQSTFTNVTSITAFKEMPMPEYPISYVIVGTGNSKINVSILNNGVINYTSSINSGGSGYIPYITYNPSHSKLYIICGNKVYSTYARTPLYYWEATTMTTPHGISSIYIYKCLNGTFFVSGYNSNMFTSTDSSNWRAVSDLPKSSWYDIQYFNEKYWACGTSGVYASTDGISWKQVLTKSSKYITWNNTKYAVCGNSGTEIYTSTDGENWDTIIASTSISPSMFAWDEKENIYIKAQYGTYYQSKDLVNWEILANYKGNAIQAWYMDEQTTILATDSQYPAIVSYHSTQKSDFAMPIDNGGTGANSLSEAKSNLGIPNVTQSLGTSTTSVMSQNAINNMLINSSSTTSSNTKVYTSSYTKNNFATLNHYHTTDAIIEDYKKTSFPGGNTDKVFAIILNGYIYAFFGNRSVYKSKVSEYGSELNFSNVGTATNGARPCGMYYDNTNVYVTNDNPYNEMYALNMQTGTLRNITINLTTEWLYCGTYCSSLNKYIVSNHYKYWLSDDNVTFTQQANNGFQYLCSNGTVIVGCGNSSGGSSLLRYSTDGLTFNDITSVGNNDSDCSSVDFAYNKFVYTNGTNIWYSVDGIAWSYLQNLGVSAKAPFSTSYDKCKIIPNGHPNKYIKFEHKTNGVTVYYAFNCETNSWSSVSPIKESIEYFDYVGTGKADFVMIRKSYDEASKQAINVYTNNFSYKIPEIPSDDATYTLKSVNGVLTWVSG